MTAVRVLLVEDQELIRTGIRMVIDAQPDLTVVGEAGDGLTGVHEAGRLRPDVVVMDVRMPVLDGIEATRRMTGLPAPPRVLMLTTYDLDEHALAALRAGASGFLLKDAAPEDMLAAVRTVHAGDAVLAASTTRRLLDRLAPPLDPSAVAAVAALTEREREVLAGHGQGLVERRDRAGADRRRGHREDPRQQRAGQAAGPGPRAGGRHRLRVRGGPARAQQVTSPPGSRPPSR